MPFSNSRVTLSNPTMPELYSTDGGNTYFVSRNLTLDNTKDADSGTYTCVASNGNAVTPSVTQEFELFVNGKLDLYNNGDSLYMLPAMWCECMVSQEACATMVMCCMPYLCFGYM